MKLDENTHNMFAEVSLIKVRARAAGRLIDVHFIDISNTTKHHEFRMTEVEGLS